MKTRKSGCAPIPCGIVPVSGLWLTSKNMMLHMDATVGMAPCKVLLPCCNRPSPGHPSEITAAVAWFATRKNFKPKESWMASGSVPLKLFVFTIQHVSSIGAKAVSAKVPVKRLLERTKSRRRDSGHTGGNEPAC
eukprot:1573340-Amphidinium_carterae.1